jgi:hypothetical protein
MEVFSRVMTFVRFSDSGRALSQYAVRSGCADAAELEEIVSPGSYARK